MTTHLVPVFPDEDRRDPVINPHFTYGTSTDKITGVVHQPVSAAWLFGFGISFLGLMLFNFAVTWLLVWGVGVWGIDIPVGWGLAITNFVWWIGIGHAGTFISAFLLLLRQEWRTSINRFAEAMTLFAVACAGMFPLLHLGRPWLFYFVFPYPNTMDLWPQFRSPLIWDVFAVSTYFTVSLVFWYVGLIPDLATLRDQKNRSLLSRKVYGFLALGWRGASRHWHRYHKAYLLLAGLAAPLVVSVHSVVGMDFSGGIVPGWHSTIFPPYFVAGAIYSGFAMVVALAVPMRAIYGLHGMITNKHLDNCAKLMLVTGLIVCYGYYTETFQGWYSGSPYEIGMMHDRWFGPYWPAWWLIIFCNCVVPQFFWSYRVRRSPWLLFVLANFIQLGMWLERFVIVCQSLHHDYLPSKWAMYYPTIWDWATLAGTIGLFFTLFFLFCRYLPVIAVAEIRELVHKKASAEGTAAAVRRTGMAPPWNDPQREVNAHE
ncbi:MAG TPA: NrfD/PsrC family molybdoenzyme membrane anchor subunit [Phycisphaerae bacterium]|nr:NrfD/PsrC family molybdoenzyme membrane anchor subunit [Phycisphaerae bacterium]